MLASLRLITISAVTLLAMPALAECMLPDAPTIPEGRTASKVQIVAAIGEVKALQAALVEYRDCIDGEIAALGEEPDQEQKAVLAQRYDDSVDLEESLATRLNSQIRDYKAAQ